MANWISSKLKAAESILQQIDQQAAESLGKSERPRLPSQGTNSNDEIPRRREAATPLKHQLPNRTLPPPDIRRPPPSNVDGHLRGDRPAADPALGLADGDWTELLGSPEPASPGIPRPVPSPNGSSSLRKLTKKIGTAAKPGRRLEAVIPGGESSERQSWDRKQGDGVPSTVSGYSSDAKLRIPAEDSRVGGAIVDLPHEVGDCDAGQPHLDIRDETAATGATGAGDGSSTDLGMAYQQDPMRNSSGSDAESDTEMDSALSSDSEEERQRREERRKRRERILAEKAAAAAAEAISEREDMVTRLEQEKQSLVKILKEREKQQAQEALELQTSTIETMEAVEQEKQKHNSTRMEALARLAKLETSNAELANLLARTQRYLEVEVNRVAELRQKLELKELVQREHNQRLSKIHSSSTSTEIESSKRAELEKEILDAEYSFICDKIEKLKDKAKKLEENIEMTRKEMMHPTEVEVELKKRLAQLTDHLIQKQAQVEALSSEKATILFRIETVSRFLDENGLSVGACDFVNDSDLGLSESSARVDVEAGISLASKSALKPPFHDRIRSGKQQLGSVLEQLDAIFSAGALFLKRSRTAQLWSMLYLLCLHLWVMYILMSHSEVSDSTSQDVVYSLETINKTSYS